MLLYHFAKHTCPSALHQDLTVDSFNEQYERPRRPVVVTGITDSWSASQAWHPRQLLQHFGQHRFKVCEGGARGGGGAGSHHNCGQPL
jgi:hypothetical protein